MELILTNLLAFTGSLLIANDASFFDLIDPTDKLQTIATQDYNFAHEAPVWLPATKELFFVSNRLDSRNRTGPGSSSQPVHIQMHKLSLDTGRVTPIYPKPEILMANGAVRVADDQIVICSQGKRSTSKTLPSSTFLKDFSMLSDLTFVI
jgi:hypothetical protein